MRRFWRGFRFWVEGLRSRNAAQHELSGGCGAFVSIHTVDCAGAIKDARFAESIDEAVNGAAALLVQHGWPKEHIEPVVVVRDTLYQVSFPIHKEVAVQFHHFLERINFDG